MVNYQSMQTDVNYIINSYGEIIRIKTYTSSGAEANYDDDVAVVQSGNSIWTSGLLLPLGQTAKSSAESILIEQGKLTYDDHVLYTKSDMILSGAFVKIGTGSPVEQEWQLLLAGVDNWGVQGNTVYKKAYIRILNNGSFIGET